MNYFHLAFSIFAFIAPSIIPSTAFSEDPFASVEHIKLDNGLNVYLAPGKGTPHMAVRLEVKVGWAVEDSHQWGVSHLLEHVLFRDQQLKDDMSYLQLIKEAGGTANGSTEARVTSYFGSIPAAKGPWLLDQFAKMILKPSIEDDYVKKEKGTVELERGRPGPIVTALGFNPTDYLYPKYPKYLRNPDFWENEYKVKLDQEFSLSEEQLSNRKLTTAQLQAHYHDYYYPSNMTLFIGGQFDRAEILSHIQNTWGKLAKSEGKTAYKVSEIEPRNLPYVFVRGGNLTPNVSLGTKVWNFELEDRHVLESYMDYLAHRLMKVIRNQKGQTYTASASTTLNDNYGYSAINFQTPKENFRENLALAQKYIRDEAENGGLSETQMKEAVDLYFNKIHLWGRDADSMIQIAQWIASSNENFGRFKSPEQVLSGMPLTEYNSRLKKMFDPKHRYSVIYGPPLFFVYDSFILGIAVFLISFALLRRALAKPFQNDQIRWIRKINYPPFKILEALALVFAFYGYVHLVRLSGIILDYFPSLLGSIAFIDYLYSSLSIIVFLLFAQGALSLLPKKLMVVGDKLVVKSVSYFSKHVPLQEIVDVTAVGTMTYPFPVTRWLRAVKHRYYFFDPLRWRKGLLISLKGGKAYYFSVTSPNEAVAELNRLLRNNKESHSQQSEVAWPINQPRSRKF